MAAVEPQLLTAAPSSVPVEWPSSFDGNEPLQWIDKVERFFCRFGTIDPYRLKIAAILFDGPVVPWFQELQQSGHVTSWALLKNAILAAAQEETFQLKTQKDVVIDARKESDMIVEMALESEDAPQVFAERPQGIVDVAPIYTAGIKTVDDAFGVFDEIPKREVPVDLTSNYDPVDPLMLSSSKLLQDAEVAEFATVRHQLEVLEDKLEEMVQQVDVVPTYTEEADITNHTLEVLHQNHVLDAVEGKQVETTLEEKTNEHFKDILPDNLSMVLLTKVEHTPASNRPKSMKFSVRSLPDSQQSTVAANNDLHMEAVKEIDAHENVCQGGLNFDVNVVNQRFIVSLLFNVNHGFDYAEAFFAYQKAASMFKSIHRKSEDYIYGWFDVSLQSHRLIAVMDRWDAVYWKKLCLGFRCRYSQKSTSICSARVLFSLFILAVNVEELVENQSLVSIEFVPWLELDSVLNILDRMMHYLFNEDDHNYLEAFGGIAPISCGHFHPEVVEVVISQTIRLHHLTVVYLPHAVADFVEALAPKMPGDLKVVFFTNSCTKANELAMMITQLYTACQDVVSNRNSYHGSVAGTMGAIVQSICKFNVIPSGLHHVVNPDQYRGIFCSEGPKYAQDIHEIIDYGTSGQVVGFISDAIQGVGGTRELAPGYLPAVCKIIKKARGLCITDEVQSGIGCTGSTFWRFEFGVIPDIMTMAKGIARFNACNHAFIVKSGFSMELKGTVDSGSNFFTEEKHLNDDMYSFEENSSSREQQQGTVTVIEYLMRGSGHPEGCYVLSWVFIVVCIQQKKAEKEAVEVDFGRQLHALMMKMVFEQNLCSRSAWVGNSIIAGCAQLGALANALQLHAKIRKHCQVVDTAIYNATIDAYTQCESVRDMVKVFEVLGNVKDLVLWNSIIFGYAQHGQGKMVVGNFSDMQDFGVKPDHITFMGIPSTSSHISLVEEGFVIFFLLWTGCADVTYAEKVFDGRKAQGGGQLAATLFIGIFTMELEARVPFLDYEFSNIARLIDSEWHGITPEFGLIEKWALRIALDDEGKPYFPKHIPYRQNEHFNQIALHCLYSAYERDVQGSWCFSRTLRTRSLLGRGNVMNQCNDRSQGNEASGLVFQKQIKRTGSKARDIKGQGDRAGESSKK